MKKQLSISIDIEPDLHTNKYNSLKALKNFLNILREHNIRATFFTTCDCIHKNPKIFLKIKEKGHEIGLHGYMHERFDTLSSQEKEENIKKSLYCFKKYLKIKPIGFRAPQHSVDDETIKLLADNNFKYDSSTIPWNFYHLIFFWKIYVSLKNNFSNMGIHKRDGIFEIPMSSFILPFSSLTLRVLPRPLLRIYFFFISLYKNPVFLMHSWDLIKIPNSKLYKLCPFDKFLNKLEYMLKYFSKKRKFVTVEEIMLSNLG